MKLQNLVWILAAMGLLAGCQSAMDRRISAHKETWRGLSEQDQHRLVQGQVRAGDTEEMVSIALGPPGSVQLITGQGGLQLTVWLYDLWESTGDFNLVNPRFPVRTTSPERINDFQDGKWVDHDPFLENPMSPAGNTRRERTIIFHDGILISYGAFASESIKELLELRAEHVTAMMEARLDRLVVLTSEQKVKTLGIFAKANEELYAISPSERPEKGMPIRVKMRADIRAILTAEQQAKYDETPQYLGGGSTKRL